MSDKKFFKMDDGGAQYYLVAVDLDHAKNMLRTSGISFENYEGDEVTFDEADHLNWFQLTAEEAMARSCNTSEDNRERGTIPLYECDIGEWYCSEW